VKYRKKTALTEATQWFKNGDHPQDESRLVEHLGAPPKLSEGKVVQHFRSLDAMESMDALNTSGNRYCPECGNVMKIHGFLDGVNGEEIICPGDYIVTDRNGLYYRLSRGEFESRYELYAPPPRPGEKPLSSVERRLIRRYRQHAQP